MPSHGRIVIPGLPHHVTQRGNRRQKVFFNDKDKAFYLRLLRRYAKKAGVIFWAYCIMDNHVHFVAVPSNETGLALAFGNTHKFYTKIINARQEWRGYLWQGRFTSFPLDEDYLYNAVRYIETNPVRAKLVLSARDWDWSSARSHIDKIPNPIIQASPLDDKIQNWKEYLESSLSNKIAREFLSHAKSGFPLGNEAFLHRLEELTGQPMRKLKPGRKGDPKR
ncbi:MAG: transposase [Acidobacteriota bacterium]|nr:transposase [Acidobacteriota bacterium]